jgi:hypothetical protein
MLRETSLVILNQFKREIRNLEIQIINKNKEKSENFEKKLGDFIKSMEEMYKPTTS